MKTSKDLDKIIDQALRANDKEKKVRITTMIDSDIYFKLQELADNGYCDGKYQKILNALLRSMLFGENSLFQNGSNDEMEKIKKDVEKLKKTIKKIS